jgi:hypothetical protein
MLILYCKAPALHRQGCFIILREHVRGGALHYLYKPIGVKSNTHNTCIAGPEGTAVSTQANNALHHKSQVRHA